MARAGVRDTEELYRQEVVLPNQSTTSRTLWTQHATATFFSALGETYNGLHYELGRVNGIGIHRDPRNLRLCD